MEKLTLSAAETARRLGIRQEKVLQMLALGEIPAVRMGRNWLVPEKALEEWLYDRAVSEANERRQ